jgi:predicted component of type VI protein secretion system
VLLEKFLRRQKPSTEVEKVIRNLNHVLNTKKSFGSYVRELGIGDYNEYKARHKIIETIIEEIKDNVRLFEPRVRLEKIDEVKAESPFRVRFQVQCVLGSGTRPISIILDSQEDRVRVED